jgi:hypothetical protein
MRGPPPALKLVAVMVLGAIAAESVAAYDETTGRPLELLWGILFFAPLYGGPAALIREAARRARLGWPTMVLASGQSAGPDAARAGWAGAIRCRLSELGPLSSVRVVSGCVRDVGRLRGCPGLSGSATWWSVT